MAGINVAIPLPIKDASAQFNVIPIQVLNSTLSTVFLPLQKQRESWLSNKNVIYFRGLNARMNQFHFWYFQILPVPFYKADTSTDMKIP